MKIYHIPSFIKFLYCKNAAWQLPAKSKVIYLKFDDGPTEELTHWILSLLKEYNAKATFFCVGANATKHPGIMDQIKAESHSIGNHTFNHLNGWKTETSEYGNNIIEAAVYIESK